MGSNTTQSITKESHLRWLIHVSPQFPGGILDPENRSRKGRLYQSWQSNVTADLREVGLTWENFSEMAVSHA